MEKLWLLWLNLRRALTHARIFTVHLYKGRHVQYNPLQYLPSSEDLPDSDDTPVDNEAQILVPTLLRAILSWL